MPRRPYHRGMRPVGRRDVHLRVWCVCLGVAVASCGRSPTAPGSTEVQTEQHTGYRLEYVAADRAVAQSLVPDDRSRPPDGRAVFRHDLSGDVCREDHARPRRAQRALARRLSVNRVSRRDAGKIAGGWATEFDILSPAVWSTQACGHDGTNANHVANVVAHELVHVLHGQRNSSFFSIAASTPWILEGLAAFASGQWAAEYAGAARLCAQRRIRADDVCRALDVVCELRARRFGLRVRPSTLRHRRRAPAADGRLRRRAAGVALHRRDDAPAGLAALGAGAAVK